MLTSGRAASFASLAVLVAVSVALAGCGGGRSKPSPPPPSGPLDRWGTVWLCRPGEVANPCVSDLTTTVVERSGATHVEPARAAAQPSIDCFYVYPTISGQPTLNATRTVGFREREVAIAQASRFSQVCDVYAPVYRQITLRALEHPRRLTLANALIAYRDVLAAFRDYLAHYNDGRGIVLIGHSQGAAILTRLIQQEVDRSPRLRSRLVSALLMGGNVTTTRGGTHGGDFAHIPACRSTTQTACVVAYSSFATRPPSSSQFGRTSSDAGVNLLAPHHVSPDLRVLCVNPASPSGGTALLHPYVPSLALAFLQPGSAASVKTPWVAFPGAYAARCESSGNATWLQVTPRGRSPAGRALLTRLQEPVLGLHVLDVNIALGDLVRLVREQALAYRRARS